MLAHQMRRTHSRWGTPEVEAAGHTEVLACFRVCIHSLSLEYRISQGREQVLSAPYCLLLQPVCVCEAGVGESRSVGRDDLVFYYQNLIHNLLIAAPRFFPFLR